MWWFVPLALVVLMLLVGFVTVASLRGAGEDDAEAAPATKARTHELPVYWTVKRGDTYSRISEKTGLAIADLETFNPTVDPTTIAPGQRLKLRLKVPKRKPKALGPKFWTLRAGQSYGSIAARTGKPIARLIELNPKLKPTALQVGDRIRLRR